MRASRLIELLLRLQLQGRSTATELATAFDVSVRTIYRDIESLCIAGVPIYTEVGRNGGVRIDPNYRIAGLPRLDRDEARGVLFAVVPVIAAQLGFDAEITQRALLPSMDSSAERAARAVHERLLIEPTHWFVQPDETPALAEVARAVWDTRQIRLTYRGDESIVEPLGLILKGMTWYVLGRRVHRGRELRLYRLSRVDAVDVLDHHFERPEQFDLAAEWTERQRAFLESLPQYWVDVRVAPGAETLLTLLDEGAPDLPLDADVERDADGWVHLRLRFERTPDATARHLLQVGGDIEVLAPPELRELMKRHADEFAARYVT